MGQMMNRVRLVTIFGGTGFIGTHLTQYLLRENLAEQIVLVDLLPPRQEPYCKILEEGLRAGRVGFREHDVRNPVAANLIEGAPDLIINLAAIHREPGHAPKEYYETNLKGAEHVCAYAAEVGCNRLVFTSSISPYGASEELKNEESLPAPETPYGFSKLAAEKIHIGWQNSSQSRKLLILRPGVVFGPGEGGNVTRLVHSVVRGYFVYMGNRSTRKAGGYVKELCRVIDFGIEHQERCGEPLAVLNFSMDPPPTMESFVTAISKIAGVRRSPMNVSKALLLGLSYPVDTCAKLMGIKQPVSPVRVRKLFRSTFIDPAGLRNLGYAWEFTLESAFRDWREEMPGDFGQT